MGAKIILSKKRYSTIYLKGLKLCIQEENITMEYLEICGTQCPKKTLQSYLSNGVQGMGCPWNTISRWCACFSHIHEGVFNLGDDVSSEEKKWTEYQGLVMWMEALVL